VVQYVDTRREIAFRCSCNMPNLVSGGFATIHPGNSLTVNAVEGAPIEDFSAEVCQISPRLTSIDRFYRLFVQTLPRPPKLSTAPAQTRIRWRHGSKLRFTRRCRLPSSNIDLPQLPKSKLHCGWRTEQTRMVTRKLELVVLDQLSDDDILVCEVRDPP